MVVVQGLVSKETVVLPEDGDELLSHLDLQLTALGQSDLANLGDPLLWELGVVNHPGIVRSPADVLHVWPNV